MIEMSIDSIRVSMMNYQRVVILKEKDAERFLPIWIGPAEADAIAIKLQGVTPPRPLTHDLAKDIITKLGASVDSIVVTDLQNDTFYANLILNFNGELLELDSRPSDATTTETEPTEEELKSLSAFADFIDTLDMDGLDQNKG